MTWGNKQTKKRVKGEVVSCVAGKKATRGGAGQVATLVQTRTQATVLALHWPSSLWLCTPL